MASLLLVVAVAASEPRLAEISLDTPGALAKLQQVILDEAQLESVWDDRVAVWANENEVQGLRKLGLNVTTEGVVDWSQLHWEEAVAASALYVHKDGEEPRWDVYCDYTCLVARLNELRTVCPEIITVSSIGRTVGGREIWVANLRNGPVAGKNAALLAGNIHGDEVTGGQLLQRLIWDICNKYQQDSQIRTIISDIDLWILPMFNPDGYQANRRTNNNGIDLNRDFPNTWTSPSDTPTGRAVETQALMAFTRERRFKLSLMHHGGALVANYAYDGRRQGTTGYSATDRDSEVVAHARGYANLNPPMSRSTQFPGGIVNGAVWYVIYGSYQDFMYDYRSKAIDLTLEVSSIKRPAASTLPQFYVENYQAMLQYVHKARNEP